MRDQREGEMWEFGAVGDGAVGDGAVVQTLVWGWG